MSEFLNDFVSTVGPFVTLLAVVAIIALMMKLFDWMD
jgi:hypothetical protein